jgi:hypothetical protein
LARGNRHLYRTGVRLFSVDGVFLRWTTATEVEQLGAVPHHERRHDGVRQVGFRYAAGRRHQDEKHARPSNRTSPSGITCTEIQAYAGIAGETGVPTKKEAVQRAHAKVHHWRKLERRFRRKLTTYPDLVNELFNPQFSTLTDA